MALAALTRMTQPSLMQAVVLHAFGGPENLVLEQLPIPSVGDEDVLIRLQMAGVGAWDPFEREGGYARMGVGSSRFPYVLGSEGAGVVSAVGRAVSRFEVGDTVYAASFLNERGGFYAQYVSVPQTNVALLPGRLDVERAGVMSGVALTALRGLDDTLGLRRGESVLIYGASGGVGHAAVQLARTMGARVFAVASGPDGAAFVERLGADAVVDGHGRGVLAAARRFAPAGFDAALFAGSGELVVELMAALRDGGRAAYPTGVEPAPPSRPTASAKAYNGEPDADVIARLNTLIERCVERGTPFSPHIAQTFPLRAAARAHAALGQHYLGKLGLHID